MELESLTEDTKFGNFLKRIADGKIEEEVKELKKEVKSVNTPEEKRILLNKTVKLLHRAIVIRHNWSTSKKFINSVGEWFNKQFGKNKKPNSMMQDRIKIIIADLSRLRDKLLDMDVRGDEDFSKLEKKIKEQRKEAEGTKLSDDDY